MKTFSITCLAAGVAAACAVALLKAAPPQVVAPKDANDPTPTLVSLHNTGAPAAKVLDDLFAQLGIPYTTAEPPGAWPALTINVDKVPYWEAATKLQDDFDLHFVSPRAASVTVKHYRAGKSDTDMGLRCISGPCLLLVRQVLHTATLADPDHPDECTIEVTFSTEPHLQIATFSSRVQPDLAVDEKGASLLRVAPDRLSKSPVPDVYNQFDIPLQPSATSGTKIADVKGFLHLGLFDEIQTVEIPAAQFNQATTARFMGATLAISPISPTPGVAGRAAPEFNFVMNISRNHLTDVQWAQVNLLLDSADISLRDADNTPYTISGTRAGGSSTNRLLGKTFRASTGLAAGSRLLGPADKCILKLPLRIKDFALPYEFKNLPLP